MGPGGKDIHQPASCGLGPVGRSISGSCGLVLCSDGNRGDPTPTPGQGRTGLGLTDQTPSCLHMGRCCEARAIRGQIRTLQPHDHSGLFPASPHPAEVAAIVTAQAAGATPAAPGQGPVERGGLREGLAWERRGAGGDGGWLCSELPCFSPLMGISHTLSYVILTTALGASVNVPLFG